MRLSLSFGRQVLDGCDLTSGSRREPSSKRADPRRIPTINHARSPFIENKRCRIIAGGIGDVVNRIVVSVYQTDAVLILI
jgi:hypothetical protein